MTDGTRLNLGTDGDMSASDDVTDAGSVAYQQKVQRVKPGWGADGSYVDPSHTTPLPVDAYTETAALSNAGTLLTPKFIKIATSGGSGDETIVSAVGGKKIRVLAYVFSVSTGVNVKWKSSAATDISGLFYVSQTGGFVSGYCPVGHMETVAGQALILNLSASATVGGHLTYVEV